MQALILAAGRGSRLGSVYGNIHKCLLEVDRRPLVDHHLEMLADAGIGPVGIVVGYSADEIRAAVGLRAEYIVNARWHTTNSLYSFLLARDWVRGPVVILNCDLLLHPRILDRLLSAGGDCLAVDSSSGFGREQMKVHVRDGLVKDMAKDLPVEQSCGENVGALCLTAEGAKALFEEAERVAASGGDQMWLSAAVREFVKKRPIRAVDIRGLPWGEVDFPYDLERVRKDVWPRIARDRGVRPLVRRIGAAAALGLFFVAGGLGAKGCLAPEPVELDTVGLPASSVTLHVGKQKQLWWPIATTSSLDAEVAGPGEVQIQARLAVQDEIPDKPMAVIEVRLNGETVDWFKVDAPVDEQATRGNLKLTRRDRFRFVVPDGTHQLTLSVVASTAAECLVRVRQPESIGESES